MRKRITCALCAYGILLQGSLIILVIFLVEVGGFSSSLFLYWSPLHTVCGWALHAPSHISHPLLRFLMLCLALSLQTFFSSAVLTKGFVIRICWFVEMEKLYRCISFSAEKIQNKVKLSILFFLFCCSIPSFPFQLDAVKFHFYQCQSHSFLCVFSPG